MWARLEGDKQLGIHFPSWIDFRCLRNHRRWMFCTFCCSNHNTIFWTDRHMARYLAWHCKHPEKELTAVLSTRRDNILILFQGHEVPGSWMPRIAFRIAPESQIYLRCRQTRDREKPCIDSFHNRNTNWRISSRQSLQRTESNFTIKETLINFSTLL